MNKLVIEHFEINLKWLVYKMPSTEIKKGIPLIVRPGQLALICSKTLMD